MVQTSSSGPSSDKTTHSLWQSISQGFRAAFSKISAWITRFKNWVNSFFNKNKDTANPIPSPNASLPTEQSSQTQSTSILKAVVSEQAAQAPSVIPAETRAENTTPAPIMPPPYFNFIPSAQVPRPELGEPLPPVETLEQIRAKEPINLDEESVKGYIGTLETSIKSLKNTWYENPNRNSFLEKQLHLGLGGKIMGEKLMKAITLIDTVNAKLKNHDKMDESEIRTLLNYTAELDDDIAFAKIIPSSSTSLKP